ncbi:hypothetical protein WAI453_013631 [Rhynchosporium graminicola]
MYGCRYREFCLADGDEKGSREKDGASWIMHIKLNGHVFANFPCRIGNVHDRRTAHTLPTSLAGSFRITSRVTTSCGI